MRISITLLFSLFLAGCTAFLQSPLVVGVAALWPQAEPDQPLLNPSFHYLRLTVEGRPVYLASISGDDQGKSSVWYSAGREVIRMRDGRIAGAVGMKDEWRQVVLPQLPDWAELAERAVPLRWTRIRDVMPGYRFGVRDELVLQRIAPPSVSELKGIEPQSLVWFEERFEDVATREVLPPARYAVQRTGQSARVVYGEQCLSRELCFTWQHWPVAGQAP